MLRGGFFYRWGGRLCFHGSPDIPASREVGLPEAAAEAIVGRGARVDDLGGLDDRGDGKEGHVRVDEADGHVREPGKGRVDGSLPEGLAVYSALAFPTRGERGEGHKQRGDQRLTQLQVQWLIGKDKAGRRKTADRKERCCCRNDNSNSHHPTSTSFAIATAKGTAAIIAYGAVNGQMHCSEPYSHQTPS